MKSKKFLFVLLCIAAMLAVLPCVGAGAAEIVGSGECGENLTWTLDNEGTLTISGTGEMWSQELYEDVPWYSKRSRIKNVTISNGVTTIGSRAFYNCGALTHIDIGANSRNYKSVDGVLFNKEMTELIQYPVGNPREEYVIPDGVATIGNYAFTSCTALTNLSLPESVAAIGNSAFNGCTGLLSVELPNGVAEIGNYAFKGCTGITDISIPDSITSIGDESFYNTAYYNDETNWENGVLYIGNHLIIAKSNISGEYAIKDGTVCIANRAFYYCRSLTSVNLSGSMAAIGDSAFYECTGLTDVYYGGTEGEWNSISIDYGNDSLTSASVHFSGVSLTPEIVSVDITPLDGTLTVSIEAENLPANCAVVVVGYGDGNGVMTVSTAADGLAQLPSEGVETVKVFVWESLESMVPLCGAETVTL